MNEDSSRPAAGRVRVEVWIGLVLVLATILVYGQTRHFDFVSGGTAPD